jgi:hypothetical protein
MELSKTVALTALLFIVVLILTSVLSFGAEAQVRREAQAKKEAQFTRSGPTAANQSVGADRFPTKKGAGREKKQAPPCQYKPVMTERDMAACRSAKRK